MRAAYPYVRLVWRRSFEFARDFLALQAGVQVLLWPVALWVLDMDASPRAAVLVTAVAACLALLGLFLTWGDGGSRLDNAVKSLFVLLLMVAAFVAVLVWAESTADEGTLANRAAGNGSGAGAGGCTDTSA